MLEKVKIGEASKMPYKLPEGFEIYSLFKGKNYMARFWRVSGQGSPSTQIKDPPHKHEGYGTVEETIILLKGKMSITAGNESVEFGAGEAVTYLGSELHQSEILERPLEAIMIVGPPVKVRTSESSVEFLKKKNPDRS